MNRPVDSEFFRTVRDYLPLQQGLRLQNPLEFGGDIHRQRLSSTTTRIKTKVILLLNSKEGIVRDYLPLQQGLRLVHSVHNSEVEVVRDYLPLQQGLRPRAQALLRPVIGSVRDYLPLQQGLRPS